MLRVLFAGMPGQFSAAVLRGLVASGVDLCGLLIPKAEGQRLRLETQPNTFSLLPSSSFLLPSVPLIEATGLKSQATQAALAALRPDVICVACFPWIFPAAVLSIPPLGCLNLHPSLLPAYRGPAPLFHQFRAGETETGVTVHFMDEGIDTGDIVLQQAVAYPDGISGAEADRLCAEAGAALMVEAVKLLAGGTLPRRRQLGEGLKRYAAWPGGADFEISTGWPARRAFNFVRATAHWGRAYELRVGGEPIAVRRAVSFSPEADLGVAWRAEGDRVWVQFAPGAVCFEGYLRKSGT